MQKRDKIFPFVIKCVHIYLTNIKDFIKNYHLSFKIIQTHAVSICFIFVIILCRRHGKQSSFLKCHLSPSEQTNITDYFLCIAFYLNLEKWPKFRHWIRIRKMQVLIFLYNHRITKKKKKKIRLEGTSRVQHACLKQGQIEKLVSLYLNWLFEKQ